MKVKFVIAYCQLILYHFFISFQKLFAVSFYSGSDARNAVAVKCEVKVYFFSFAEAFYIFFKKRFYLKVITFFFNIIHKLCAVVIYKDYILKRHFRIFKIFYELVQVNLPVEIFNEL